MFRNNIFTILLFGSLCVSVTTASAEVVFKEDFSGYYSNGINEKINSANNDPFRAARVLAWWGSNDVKMVEISTIATYDTTGGLQSVPIPVNPAILPGDVPSGRGGNVTHGALFFPYSAGIKKSAEQRYALQPDYLNGRDGLTEVWIQYDQFIPSNFYDRIVSGEWGSKAFVLYAERYATGQDPNLMTGRSGDSNGNSRIVGQFYWNKISDGSRTHIDYGGTGQKSIELAIDNGQWQRRTFHFKLPTTESSNDGMIEMWIEHGNGVIRKHIEVLNGNFLDINSPWINHGYLLGWSNPGFEEPTSFLITNFILSESAEHIDKRAIVYVAAPKSPASMLAVKK